jgi:hypothetical protein
MDESRSDEYRRLIEAWRREHVSKGDRRVGRSGAGEESRKISDIEHFDVLGPDVWGALSEELSEEFLDHRMDSTCASRSRQESDGSRWEPLRPVVIGEGAYRDLESLAARLLHLAVDSCRRRASGRPRILEFNNSSRLGGAPARGGLRRIVSAERCAPAALRGDRVFRAREHLDNSEPPTHCPRPLDEHHE